MSESKKSLGKSACTRSGRTSSRKKSAASATRRKGESKDELTRKYEKCFEVAKPHKHPPCKEPPQWQLGKYRQDECGSGIVPLRYRFNYDKHWCKTPLSMYQATVGEFAKQVLCRERLMTRDIRPPPPCNVCENILRPCRGYYRKYACLRPCEEEFAKIKDGKKTYREPVEQYWNPCLSDEAKEMLDINHFAHHNVFLGQVLRRRADNVTPCW